MSSVESGTSIAAKVTIGDDAGVTDDGDHTYPIPNEESGRPTLVRKSNSSSVIWNYFGFHADKFGALRCKYLV